MRIWIASLFLLLQLGSVIYARFTPRRYFSWAPNDYVVEYELLVKVHGQPLPPEQILARYHMAYRGEVEYPAEHLIDNFEQYEKTYGRNDRAELRLRWKYNGHSDLKTWQWPQ